MSHSETLSRLTVGKRRSDMSRWGHRDRINKSSRNGTLKRTFALILAVLAAATLFGGLVHAVLVAAHVSEPAAATVYGLTLRRVWATTVVVVGLIGVVNGGLVLASANGGPGSGNGVVGGAAALVLGLIATVLGGLGLARRRIALGPGA